MSVPIDGYVFDAIAGPKDRNQRDAALDQSTGLQNRLPVGVPTMSVAERVGFLGEIDSVASRGRVTDYEGARVVVVERRDARVPFDRPPLSMDVRQKGLAVVQSPCRNLGRQAEVADSIVAGIGIGIDHQRIKTLPEPAGSLAVAFLDKPGHVVLELG